MSTQFLPSATDLILVAVINNRRDLEIARILGWYRIPLRTAPRTVNVDWLALYQTAKFGEEKWAVNYVARVRGHELTTRAELLRTQPDHPRASEQYYKVQLGPLVRLAQPIPSRRWRRFTFLYTTGERLAQATEINDLVVQSAEREMLYRALRERGLLPERVPEADGDDELDLALLCQLGQLGIALGDGPPSGELRERAGREYLAFSESDVLADLPGVVRQVEAAVRRLGGPASVPPD
ncbi:MAG: hypothetical protein HY784_14135 [Chloroflexi bacterium]|nr:hypothetical protein [Chloroflexota bacterium]